MMRRGKHFLLPVYCLGLALLVACGPGNERKDVLPTERMADVLYDYQLAQTLSEQLADSVPTAPIEYRLSVFKKYGITAQEFDHSLAYYSRHADEMKEVYARIQNKYGQDGGNDPAAGGSAAQSGDSLLIWQAKQRVLTAQVSPHVTFRVQPGKKVPNHAFALFLRRLALHAGPQASRLGGQCALRQRFHRNLCQRHLFLPARSGIADDAGRQHPGS